MDPTWSQNCLFPIINPPFFWGILVMVSSIRFPDLAVHTGYCECSEVGLGCQTTADKLPVLSDPKVASGIELLN